MNEEEEGVNDDQDTDELMRQLAPKMMVGYCHNYLVVNRLSSVKVD